MLSIASVSCVEYAMQAYMMRHAYHWNALVIFFSFFLFLWYFVHSFELPNLRHQINMNYFNALLLVSFRLIRILTGKRFVWEVYGGSIEMSYIGMNNETIVYNYENDISSISLMQLMNWLSFNRFKAKEWICDATAG